MTKKFFPSKILLFGEYTATSGSGALAVPFFGKSAHWDQQRSKRDEDLIRFCEFLTEKEDFPLKSHDLCKDIRDGWYVESDIPRGYGLGSSGALIAAIYDTYRSSEPVDLHTLKNILAGMESFFHGRSSGIDPLVSYLKEPVFISAHEVRKANIPPVQNARIFLLDSFSSRNTEYWVHHFQQKKQKDSVFHEQVEIITEWNEKMIETYLSGDPESFWSLGKKISNCQFHYFREFIPEAHQNVWENSLLRDDFFLKLCGAGGGGYTLGFAKHMESVFMDTMAFNPTWIY